MFVHEGKNYYSIKEAAEKTGYKEGTITDYINKNFVEGARVLGAWALTETGMKQLTIRKTRIEKELKESPTPDFTKVVAKGVFVKPKPIPKSDETKTIKPAVVKVPTKPESKPVQKKKKKYPEPAGTSIKFNTKKGYAVADCLRDLSKVTGKSMKELGIDIIADGLRRKRELLDKYNEIEQEKSKLLEQLRNV